MPDRFATSVWVNPAAMLADLDRPDLKRCPLTNSASLPVASRRIAMPEGRC